MTQHMPISECYYCDCTDDPRPPLPYPPPHRTPTVLLPSRAAQDCSPGWVLKPGIAPSHFFSPFSLKTLETGLCLRFKRGDIHTLIGENKKAGDGSEPEPENGTVIPAQTFIGLASGSGYVHKGIRDKGKRRDRGI